MPWSIFPTMLNVMHFIQTEIKLSNSERQELSTKIFHFLQQIYIQPFHFRSTIAESIYCIIYYQMKCSMKLLTINFNKKAVNYSRCNLNIPCIWFVGRSESNILQKQAGSRGSVVSYS